MSYHYTTAILSLFASASLLMAAGGGATVPVPGFTKGDPMPPGFTHVRKAIADIEAATDKPELRRLR